MKKAELEALIKSTIDQQAIEQKKQISKLKAQLKETEKALDQVLDIAEDRGLSTALYMQFVTKKNLMEDFKQFLLEYNSKQNTDIIH